MINLFEVPTQYNRILFNEKLGINDVEEFCNEDIKKSKNELKDKNIFVDEIIKDIGSVMNEYSVHPYLLGLPNNHQGIRYGDGKYIFTDKCKEDLMLLIGGKSMEELKGIVEDVIKNNLTGRFISIRYLGTPPDTPWVVDRLLPPEIRPLRDKGGRKGFIEFNTKTAFIARTKYIQIFGYNPFDKHPFSIYDIYK